MKIETRKGLWVSDSFSKKFGNEEIEPSEKVPGYKVLGKSMSDAEIKKELGVQECTLGDVAAFLENAPKDTDDGNYNLFYVSDCVVGVGWYRDRREWLVSAWELDDDRWYAVGRAFSSNWPSEPVASGAVTLESLASRIEELQKRVEKLEEAYDD